MKMQKMMLGLGIMVWSMTANAVDLNQVPDLRKVNIVNYNENAFQQDLRPKACTYSSSEFSHSPVCFDSVISFEEAHIHYDGKDYRLGKPLTKNNQAKKNNDGLQALINKMGRNYAGTKDAVKENKEDLKLITAGLFNNLNNKIDEAKPYFKSILDGHYDKATLVSLQEFITIHNKIWKLMVNDMVKYQGISVQKAENSSRYFKEQLNMMIKELNKLGRYYQ
ncbi:hypothetical protein [Actinobacillus equuli]|uniref:hypothetical protein n=1 Tax=Actinobacillus equuli TaxID=718 RepID=UPI0024424A07|nr:hypothetical protein [Actinobacillus equuli]WGE57305.1 hypothetical protein NYR71_00695 [Actinobacillus equuli subsp. equuli]